MSSYTYKGCRITSEHGIIIQRLIIRTFRISNKNSLPQLLDISLRPYDKGGLALNFKLTGTTTQARNKPIQFITGSHFLKNVVVILKKGVFDNKNTSTLQRLCDETSQNIFFLSIHLNSGMPPCILTCVLIPLNVSSNASKTTLTPLNVPVPV